jgi:hypothetical protein
MGRPERLELLDRMSFRTILAERAQVVRSTLAGRRMACVCARCTANPLCWERWSVRVASACVVAPGLQLAFRLRPLAPLHTQDTELEVVLRSQNALEQFDRRDEPDPPMHDSATDYMDSDTGVGPKS